jgi:hypothetical protein
MELGLGRLTYLIGEVHTKYVCVYLYNIRPQLKFFFAVEMRRDRDSVKSAMYVFMFHGVLLC